MRDGRCVIVAAEPHRGRRPALRCGQPVDELRAIDVYERVFVFRTGNDGRHAVRRAVRDRRIVVVSGGVGAVIGLDIPPIRVLPEAVRPAAPPPAPPPGTWPTRCTTEASS